MSYIIAFVSYANEERTYPVSCWRTDIKPGDAVVVQQGHGSHVLKWARVDRLLFLNWECKHHIACLASEARFDSLGILLPKPIPMFAGLSRPEEVWHHLRQSGWTRCPTVSRLFKSAFCRHNGRQFANIFFRSNGVDIQIINGNVNEALTTGGELSFFQRDHFTVVRHTLSHSHLNLFEMIVRFAEAFQNDAGQYEEFLKPVGKSDRRTDALKQMAAEGREGKDLYAALGGYGGAPLYVSDGLYLTAGGIWTDG